MSQTTLKKYFLHIKNNQIFEWIVILIIISSSVTIGMRTYPIESFLFTFIEWLDITITLFFLIEILIRIGAEKRWRDFFTKGWNIFDFLIIAFSLIPIDDNEYALLGRLLRLFRVMRLISFIPELRLLTNSLFIAVPRMGYVIIMMFIVFYIYAMIGTLFFKNINPELWGNAGISMLTLFRVVTFEDWTDIMYETMEVYPLSWLFYLSFIFLSAFVFLNMMIGIIVSVFEEEQQKETIHNSNKNLEQGRQKIMARLDELSRQITDINAQQKLKK